MGFLDVFTSMIAGKQQGQVAGEFNGQDVTAYAFMSSGGDGIEGHTIEALWKSQPHLRTVVGFIARQMSQLSLKLYERDGDEIKRVRTGKVAQLLRTPNGEETFSELMYALVGEWALRDDSYLVLLGGELRVFPAKWITPVKRNAFQVDGYKLVTKNGESHELTTEQVFRFKGWTPSEPLKATSPVETLKLMLEEQHSARMFRKQVWKRGGRFGGFLTRPAGAPKWDNAARGRFDRMWQAFTGNGGARAGDAPLLEDGMEYKTARIAAKEDQWLESVRASLEMCAQVYYINPTMVGLLDNANFANVREFRRSLYGDSLGPIVKKIEDRFNSFILPALGAPENQYVEFNVEAKLRGSFEEQAAVVSTATGAPWQTVNESRKLFNLSPVEGGDDMVRPLNVLFGGQASPRDGQTAGGGGPAPELEAAPVKVGPTADDIAKLITAATALIRAGFDPQASLGAVGLDPIEHLGLLPVTVRDDAVKAATERFLVRQYEAVQAKRHGGVDRWWDQQRWDRELADDLSKSGLSPHLARPVANGINTLMFEHYSSGSPAIQTMLEVGS
ncbi:phage portal protein [Leucobacter muris]|uniref:Phage portal protein n=1 Tax=Leucobacter muris TaxID=1935379 RepID=A0ABX5QID7_9MICO|nr:phage portal protein [Leucobacter muris]QAB18783.1 phage portal protein [Leucobacter muris]